jgi:cellulose synthase/poly-beta-1,6-N-acetylglucosamine synthase-like glycosyltransferase
MPRGISLQASKVELAPMPDFIDILGVLLWLAQVASLLYVGYRCLLGVLSLRPHKLPLAGSRNTRFLVLIPAHNESAVIGESVLWLKKLQYPSDRMQVVVVADACTDDTATFARAAGAQVLVKPAPASNKGNAIQWALERPEIIEAQWDALVILDGDSKPWLDFLELMDGALERGARVVQGRRDSAEQHGLIPRGYAVNTAARNRLWHHARERAGFSGALTGAGICIKREILQEVPPNTQTLTEDLEYTAKLTQAGVRVHYMHDAGVQIEQPPSLAPSVMQRVRWARGQLRTAFMYGPGLVWKSIRQFDLSAFDTALYLLIPSLVPLQAILFLMGMGELLLGESWPDGGMPHIPLLVVAGLLAFSVVLPYAGLLAERRRPTVPDLLAFMFLMATWMPVAVFAAMTTWVQTWHRTPRADDEASPATTTAPTREEDDLKPAPSPRRT